MTAMNAMKERRRLLKLLVAGGVLGPAAAGAMQEDAALTTDILERAAALFDAGIAPERIREILPAVQRNRDFFNAVRELEIGDDVEPAPMFQASRSGGS
jgi:hypothetical protein